MWGLKQVIKEMLPAMVLERLRAFRFRRLNRRVDADFAGDHALQVFSRVYQKGIWGRKLGTEFYSGSGSHDSQVVDPYVRAVGGFLSSLPFRPSAVDLGCGDFNVGSRIRPFCDGYVACDIVPGLIDHNRASFSGVDFRCLNAAVDELPDGDVIFLRQVLQHLSNSQIMQILPKLRKYRFLVLTESVPALSNFRPNVEKQTGPGMRIASRSGVAITEPPFSLSVATEQEICVVPMQGSLVRTIVYELQPASGHEAGTQICL